MVGEIGEDELYALLREHWLDGKSGDESVVAKGDDNRNDPYGGLEQLEAVVCTQLTTWCGSKAPKPKKKKKQGKVQKDKGKNRKQKKKVQLR